MMESSPYDDQIFEILKTTFPAGDFDCPKAELVVGCVEQWDSLGNFNFLLAVEEHYGFQFDLDAMATLDSFEMIVQSVKEHLNQAQ